MRARGASLLLQTPPPTMDSRAALSPSEGARRTRHPPPSGGAPPSQPEPGRLRVCVSSCCCFCGVVIFYTPVADDQLDLETRSRLRRLNCWSRSLTIRSTTRRGGRPCLWKRVWVRPSVHNAFEANQMKEGAAKLQLSLAHHGLARTRREPIFRIIGGLDRIARN